MKLANHTALKEWAAVISAIGAGDQILLLRKGGIAEGSFELETSRFYLLPTYLHQKEKQFKASKRDHFTRTDRGSVNPPELPVEVWCEVVRKWRVKDLEVLMRLDPHLIFTSETILERYNFRPDQAVQIVAVRGYRLPSIHLVKSRDEYAGCRSWVSVDEEIDIDGSVPALDQAAFDRALGAIEETLAVKGDQPSVAAR